MASICFYEEEVKICVQGFIFIQAALYHMVVYVPQCFQMRKLLTAAHKFYESFNFWLDLYGSSWIQFGVI